jgi:3-oxoacyl-[acyl-carrier-protein] synthase II
LTIPQRVVVTGLGAITPLGLDVPTTWAALVEGRSAGGPITQFDASDCEVRIGCEVKGFDPRSFMDHREARRTDRFTQYALGAAKEALADSGINKESVDPWRVGVLIATGIGGIHTLVDTIETIGQRGPSRGSPLAVPMLMANAAAGNIAITHGFHGPNYSISSACASSNHALGEAMETIKRGDADVMVAGGAEAALALIAVATLGNAGALSKRNDDPAGASRPFDATRDGFVWGEGAAVLILESLEHARQRGARIYAEMCGYGATCDAYHITAPLESGEAAVRCMQLALAKSELRPEDVDYINAHGTSTPLNDKSETAAIKQVFGPHAYKVAVSSTKSMIGHLIGASGAAEAVATVLTIHNGVIHPTINYHTPDPDCDLDYVPNVARKANVRVAISNGFGFGGHNATIVFKQLAQ